MLIIPGRSDYQAMQLQGALVTEQNVKFGIVVVKKAAMQTDLQANQTRAAFQTQIADFANIPLVLAAQDAQGRFEYHGRPDIVKLLASTDPARIPWREYTVS